MFETFTRRIVYRSKDEEDWKKAQEILKNAGIEHTAWVSEEPPVGGCGSKLDIRTFASKKKLPRAIFSIEVSKESEKTAKQTLDGKVLPPRSYGVSQ